MRGIMSVFLCYASNGLGGIRVGRVLAVLVTLSLLNNNIY